MIARGLVSNGVKSYITERKAEACDSTASQLSELGTCISVPADLSTEVGRKSLVDQVSAEESQLDSKENIKTVNKIKKIFGGKVITLSAKLEEEIGVLPDEESQEYLELAGISESGLDKVIRGSYELLGLISYFSFNTKEVRAWTINKGSTAPQAAGVIHTDFERGFIKAEVVQFDIFEEHGSFPALKIAGLLRIEGREYVVQDGDVVYFRFNV